MLLTSRGENIFHYYVAGGTLNVVPMLQFIVNQKGKILSMKNYLFATLLLFNLFLQTKAQQPLVSTIKGQVLDRLTNEPVIGASVVLVGTTLGAATDIEGNFTITNVPAGVRALRVSAVGYQPYVVSDIMVMTAKPAEVRIFLTESPVELEAVQTTASYFQTLPDRPLSNLVQSNEEIRRLPGGLEDVVRAVSILPGVAQAQAGRNDLIVRGGAPSENLFLIDNIEVGNINHFGTQGASGGPLSFVNLDYVAQTSFSTGGFSAKYGDKLSSVLTIDLKNGRSDRLGSKATISASQFGLDVEGPLDENGSFVLSARRSYLDFIFKAAGFGFVPEYWDFLGRMNYKLSPKDQLVVLGIGALDNVKLFTETAEKRYDNSRILGSNQNQFIGGLTWKHIMEKAFSTVTIGQTYVDYEYFQNDSLLQPVFRNTSYEQEIFLKADVVTYLTEKTEVSFGVALKNARFSSDILLALQTTPFGESIGLNAFYRTRATKSALYAQLSQPLGDVRVTVGGRVDYFDLIENKFTFSPRFSFVYALTPELNLSASIGRYYQAPSYIWLVANSSNRQLQFVGADQFIFGTEYFIRPDMRLSVETYRKNYFNYPASTLRPYLVLANTGAGFGGAEEGFASFGFDPLVSSGKGRVNGIELLLQKKLSEVPHYGIVSISYTKSEFKGIDGIWRPGAFDQRWIINVGGGVPFQRGMGT